MHVPRLRRADLAATLGKVGVTLRVPEISQNFVCVCEPSQKK